MILRSSYLFALGASSLLAWSLGAVGCSQFSSNKTGTEATSSVAAGGETIHTSDPKLIAKYSALAGDILESRRKEVEVVRSILEQTYRDAEIALAHARETLKTPNSAAARPAFEELAMLVGYIATEGDPSVALVRKRLIEGGHHFNPLTSHANDQGMQHHGTPGSPAHQAPGQGHQAPGQGHQAAPPPPGQGHHAAGQEPPAPGAPVAAPPPAGQAPSAAAPAQPAPGQEAPGGHHAAGEKPAEGAHHHAGPEAHHSAEAGHHEGNVPLIGYDPGYVVVPRSAKKTLLDASKGLARIAASPSPAALETEWRAVESTCLSLGIAKK